MNWLNIESRTLDSPEVIGAEPVDRATWLFLLRFCIGQENGGKIVGAKNWSDRKWQQLCRVTAAEIEHVCDLWRWQGNDLIVWAYPAAKENEVRAKRDGSKRTNKSRWGTANRSDSQQPNGSASRSATRSASQEGEGEGNRKEKGKGIEPLKVQFPDCLQKAKGFTDIWSEFLIHRREIKKPMTPESAKRLLRHLEKRPQDATAALDMAIRRGWQGFEWGWFDKERQQANGSHAPHDLATPEEIARRSEDLPSFEKLKSVRFT